MFVLQFVQLALDFVLDFALNSGLSYQVSEPFKSLKSEWNFVLQVQGLTKEEAMFERLTVSGPGPTQSTHDSNDATRQA